MARGGAARRSAKAGGERCAGAGGRGRARAGGGSAGQEHEVARRAPSRLVTNVVLVHPLTTE